MTEREKIINIVGQNKYCGVDTANALIEAGFISLKESSDMAREACDILRNIKDDEIKCICKEKDDLARRAEVVERAYDNIMGAFHELLSAIFPDKKIDLDDWKKDNLANAEKELARRIKNEPLYEMWAYRLCKR